MATRDDPSYPVSDVARERIARARLLEVSIEIHLILARGGFSPDEIAGAVDVLAPLIAAGERPLRSEVEARLLEKGLGQDDARLLAEGFPVR